MLKFSTKTEKLQPLEFSASKYDFNSGNITVEKQFSVGDKATFSDHVEINKGLFVGSSYVEQDAGVIKAQNKCEALYFNATSDRRAKSNITPVEFSALDTIKQLPVYTFNYLFSCLTAVQGSGLELRLNPDRPGFHGGCLSLAAL